MKFFEYVKSKVLEIIVFLLLQAIAVGILFCFNSKIEEIILIIIIEVLIGAFLIVATYCRKRNFYNPLIENLYNLDKKFYILETIKKPDTYEEKMIVDMFYEINKSMCDEINRVKKETSDFEEFVELWIHEVKMPISSLMLKCHNNSEKYSKSFLRELRRLDNYADEILYYVRSENTENDFCFDEIDLKKIIRNVSLRNKDDINDLSIGYKVRVEKMKILSDRKWLEFIINQIINNSIKYRNDENPEIKIISKVKNGNVVLEITDNGIGISKKDLPRVFEKSFTGDNGRKTTKSTGMGLFIVKNLCEKLGHRIDIESEKDEYTTVRIVFCDNDWFKI